MPTDEQKNRLANIIGWLGTAKENLPAINADISNVGTVNPDHILEVSRLLDRMHHVAVSLERQIAGNSRRQAA